MKLPSMEICAWATGWRREAERGVIQAKRVRLLPAWRQRLWVRPE